MTAGGRPEAGGPSGDRWGRALWPVALVGLFWLAFGLRAWSLRHGLPYSYNVDEDGHFAPVAVNTVLNGWNPHYFENPPAFSYLLRLVFQIGWGKGGLVVQWANDPVPMLMAARWTTVVLGSLACVVTALAGARLFSRGAGLVAGTLLAVACLPVAYSHFALNDVPALLPIAVALWATAGLCGDRGRLIDWVVAGGAIGVGASTKYTAGVAVLALLCVVIAKRRSALVGLGCAAVSGIGGFLVTNPYSLLALAEFREGLSRQSDFSSQKLIGLWTANPFSYYGGVSLWGFGLLPLLAAIVGAVVIARSDRLKACVLIVPSVVLMASLSVNLILSGEGQMYSRWLLPAFPSLCLLAGLGATVVTGRVALALRPSGVTPRVNVGAATIVLLALAAQGVFLSARVDTVLGRTDTRQQLRDWMVTHVPRGSKIGIEAFSLPVAWYRNPAWAVPRLPGPDGAIWDMAQPFITALSPGRIDEFRREGRCLLIVTSNIRDRALAEPAAVPGAVAFYRRLDRESVPLFSTSPWKPGLQPRFDFDRSYLYFDGSHERPGPRAEVRALKRCRERNG